MASGWVQELKDTSMATEEGEPVNLYIYDLSQGMASLLSPAILGRQIEAIWHTSVVVYGREYFFGGGGITSCEPGSTSMGAPLQVDRLGTTFVPFQLFVDYLHSLSNTCYTPSSYNLLSHNCNTFSDEVAQFLCGGGVPKHILRLPEEALSPPLRAALQAVWPTLQGATQRSLYTQAGVSARRRDSPDFDTLNHQIEQARIESAALEERRSTLAEKLARKERKREKKKQKMLKEQARLGIPPDSEEEMAEALPEPVAVAAAAAAGPSRADLDEAEEAVRRPAVPPILYNDMDPATEFEKLEASISKLELSPELKTSVDELRQYLVAGEGSWVLGDNFPDLLSYLLSAERGTETRVATLRCVACCGRRDDVTLLLHAERRSHALMSHAAAADLLPAPDQHALALFICNMFELVPSSEWLMYISEWELPGGRTCSNIRATTKVCVTALLAEQPELKEIGAAILYNIATKEVKTVVFDEVCVELGMAALQALSQAGGQEEVTWRVVAALRRLLQHSAELPALVAMVGPDPAAYRGTSQRVDEEIDKIMAKINK